MTKIHYIDEVECIGLINDTVHYLNKIVHWNVFNKQYIGLM